MTATEALAPPARYVTEIPIDEIHPVDHNRHLGDHEGLEGMAATMRVVGVLEPLLVRSTTGHGYELIAGARRQAAARIAGLATVPCLIENHRSDEDVELARIIENLQRLDPTELEEAAAYDRLTRPPFNLTAQAIAESVGRSESHISKRRSLLVLPAEAKAALEDRRINIQTALGITSLARDRARLDSVIDALPAPDASAEELEHQRQELERTLARELRDAETARRRAAKITELEDAGETVVDYPKWGQWHGTGYRVVRGDEAHEAVAVDDDGRVVKVTSKELSDKQRHAPKPPAGADVGFVEQARRKKQQELDTAVEPRRAIARQLLDEPGHDAVLQEYVINHVLAIYLTDGDYLGSFHTNLALDLLGQELDVAATRGDLTTAFEEYAKRTTLTRLRATAAALMSASEADLVNTFTAREPGSWAPVPDDLYDDEEHGPLRRYLALLERHGYTLTDDERAAITPTTAVADIVGG